MNTALLKDERKLDTMIHLLFSLMMAVIAAVCLGLSWILYAQKRETLPNIVLMPLGVAAVFAVVRGVRYPVNAIPPERRKIIGIACSLGALLLQIALVRSYYFYTDWDVETIVECAMASVTGGDISRHSNYFSMYPNNLVLVTLYGWVIRLAYALEQAEHAYFALLIFQCIICWATGLMLCAMMDRLLHNDALTAAAWVLYQLLVGLSPWISIPYSDSVALFFPMALVSVVFLMPRSGIRGMLRLFLLAFLAYFGYRIKPQIAIVFIALVLYGAAALILNKKRMPLHLPGCIGRAGVFAAGVLCALLLANSMADDVQVPINEELAFGIPHFLMMGMNTEEFGAYAQRDVSFSWRCATRAERTQKNLEVFAERIRESGPVGIFKQLIRKTLTNFNDGTFCWAGEGVFYREVLEETDPILSPMTRSVYYSHEGAGYPVWANFAQAVWMGVLLLSACAGLAGRDQRLSVVMLSVIGLTMFETLFEARARYLFCYAPLFIMLAVAGLHAVQTYVQKILKKEN